jgi:creatinine amidohydrolase
MRFEDLNWMDVEEYLKNDDRLILVLGACEQHGYLSLLTDVKIPQALADAASKKTGVLIAPSVNCGVSPYFLKYPGTISLRSSTFSSLLEDIVSSVHGHGFRRILVLNGHGGNDGARNVMVELANQLQGLKVTWYSWWTSEKVLEVAHKKELKSSHAGWIEAFPFVRVGDLPDEDKIIPSYQGLLNAQETRDVYGDGMFGGVYRVDDHIMNEIFTAALEEVLGLLAFSY